MKPCEILDRATNLTRPDAAAPWGQARRATIGSCQIELRSPNPLWGLIRACIVGAEALYREDDAPACLLGRQTPPSPRFFFTLFTNNHIHLNVLQCHIWEDSVESDFSIALLISNRNRRIPHARTFLQANLGWDAFLQALHVADHTHHLSGCVERIQRVERHVQRFGVQRAEAFIEEQ